MDTVVPRGFPIATRPDIAGGSNVGSFLQPADSNCNPWGDIQDIGMAYNSVTHDRTHTLAVNVQKHIL